MDPEKLGSDPFIRQVMADVERATGTDALETYTTKGGHTYRPGDALDSHTDEHDSVIRLVIDHVDEEHVWYTTPDMPERGVAEMFRPLFETYLDNGVFQPASAPEASAIRRGTSGSIKKFCPMDLEKWNPCRASRSRMVL